MRPVVTRALALTAALLLVAPSASAEVSTFFRMGAGVGNVRTHASVRATPPSITDGVSRTAFVGELSIGGTLDRKWVLAATLLEHVVTFDRTWKTTPPLDGDFTLTLAVLGVTFERHPATSGGWFYGGTLGVCEHSFGTSDRPVGLAVTVQGGWDLALSPRSSLGLGVRVLYARMQSERAGGSLFEAFAPSLSLHYVFR